MVAGWEWRRGGSASEASARYACAKEVIETLGLSDEDLEFSRAWQISTHARFTDDDALFDAFTDMLKVEGYSAVVDLIETKGFDGLRDHLTAPAALASEEKEI